MIISHEFYLIDAIAGIAKTTPSAAMDSINAVHTAIEESSLDPAIRREFHRQLQDAVTQRICVFFEKMNYIDMRQYVKRLVAWVLENSIDDRNQHQLLTALEKHAQPIDSVKEEDYEEDPFDDEYNLIVYPDDVSWRMLIDYESNFEFPYVVLDNEGSDDEDDDASGHFRWRKFVNDHKWTPILRHESRMFDTLDLGGPLVNKQTTYGDLTFALHERSTLIYQLDDSSCANLIIHYPDEMGSAVIIPRIGIALHIGVDRASQTTLLEDSLRIENAAIGLFVSDVSDELVYEHPHYERSATVELMDDGDVRILTPPSGFPFFK